MSTFMNMQKVIETCPTNEKELKETREFIAVSKNETQPILHELLKEVDRHYGLLDDYSWHYDEADINFFYDQKMWPMKIG